MDVKMLHIPPKMAGFCVIVLKKKTYLTHTVKLLFYSYKI